MKKPHSRYRIARNLLLFWCLFIGVGAVGGAVTMFIDPMGVHTGMGGLLPGLQKLPFADTLFHNLTFPGIALLCVNGIPNLIAAWLLFANKKAGAFCGALFGVTLMLWITIQFCVFPSNILSNSYFVFGLLQALTGCAALIFYQQEHFTVRREDYPNIGTSPDRLVVYFSRMGYTKKAALEAANRTGAAVYEVKSTERTAGTLGFWWCGRFGMHRWEMPIVGMPIEGIASDLSAYSHVTVCSPIWVFHLAAPMRAFCRAAKGKIREADYILVHFQPWKYTGVVKEMNDLLGVSATGAQSICCQQGQYLRVWELPVSAGK